ncbi:MAG: HNH endonuclease signature motif containing protein [Acidimicrobiia bacterium]
MLRVVQVITDARAALADLEAGTFSPGDAARLAEEIARLENAAAAARVKMAARAAQGSAHRWRGFTDPATWMAATTGATLREARLELEAVALVEQCPETSDALASGEVSLAQAGTIARAEAEAPGCEEELLAVARGGTLSAVRRVATSRRLEAMDRDELHEKQREARHCSHWRDDLGMIRISASLTPDVGVPLLERLDRETKRRWRESKRGGFATEPYRTLAADVFAELLGGSPPSGPVQVFGTVVIDWPALLRGHLHPGERSHIVGGGPIPPTVAKAMLEHAFLKVVLTDGVEVQRVVHFGRHIPAELRTALELGPPPEFAGLTCSEVGCDRRYGLEWDHVVPIASGGPTSLDNLRPKCGPHHAAKTARDRASGLLGPMYEAESDHDEVGGDEGAAGRDSPERGPPRS